MPWEGYAAQVRQAYAAGRIEADELERDLQVAFALDNGHWEPDFEVPRYLRDSNGYLLRAPGSLQGLV